MNLGFDFDKIFINYPPFIPGALIDRLYKNKTNGMLSYRIPSKLEQRFRLITHYPIFRPAILENIQFIKNVSKQNSHKYYLISSRFSFLKDTTNTLIKKYQLDDIFHTMHFNFENRQPHVFKEDIIKKLNVHRYVDDDLALLKFLLSKNKKTIFFWLNNKREEKLGKNLFAVTKLSDMLKNK